MLKICKKIGKKTAILYFRKKLILMGAMLTKVFNICNLLLEKNSKINAASLSKKSLVIGGLAYD